MSATVEGPAVLEALAALCEDEADAWNQAADTLDAWADESRTGFWSTHQVKANEAVANAMRRRAAKLRQYVTTLRGLT